MLHIRCAECKKTSPAHQGRARGWLMLVGSDLSDEPSPWRWRVSTRAVPPRGREQLDRHGSTAAWASSSFIASASWPSPRSPRRGTPFSGVAGRRTGLVGSSFTAAPRFSPNARHRPPAGPPRRRTAPSNPVSRNNLGRTGCGASPWRRRSGPRCRLVTRGRGASSRRARRSEEPALQRQQSGCRLDDAAPRDLPGRTT